MSKNVIKISIRIVETIAGFSLAIGKWKKNHFKGIFILDLFNK